MVGDTVIVSGVEFEVVWSGGEGLIPDRRTKVVGPYSAPPRIYNKTGKHVKKQTSEVKILTIEDN